MNFRNISAAVLAAHFLVFNLVAVAPPKARRQAGLEPAAAQGDFRIMNRIFSEAHATAFGQIPAGETPEIFKDMKNVTVRDFVMGVLRYYRGIKVDHTGLGFSPELIQELEIRNSLFPFPLHFIEGKAYFDCEYQDIPFGSELRALNGETIGTLLAEFKKVAGSDDDYRASENFSFLYYMARGVPKEWRFTVKGKNLVFPVVAGGNPPIAQRHSASLAQARDPIFIAFNPSIKAAYLAINSFMPKDSQLDSVESWDNYMNLFNQEARARKAENLVIDLRQNRGGIMPFSAAAARWFIDKKMGDKSKIAARTRVLPYRQYALSINTFAVNEEMLREMENYLSTTFADKQIEGYFPARNTETRYMQLAPIPDAHRFKKICILVGPATYSAAVFFARLVRLGHKNVVIAGEETGSPGDGHSAEFLVTYKLPASGLLVEIPLVKVDFSPLVEGQLKGRGLRPDVPYRETAADFAADRDGLLEHVSRQMAGEEPKKPEKP